MTEVSREELSELAKRFIEPERHDLFMHNLNREGSGFNDARSEVLAAVITAWAEDTVSKTEVYEIAEKIGYAKEHVDALLGPKAKSFDPEAAE